MPRRPRLVVTAVLAAALAVTTGLTGCVPAGSSAPVPATAADAKWGQAPTTVSGVTLQPDVVMIGGGGASVDQVTSDGLTWVLKKNAPNVDQLKVGKVMFVTGDGVGRVLALKTVGDQTAVTISPVGITDVIRDGDFTVPKPVPLDRDAIVMGTPSLYSDNDLISQLGPQPDPFTVPALPASGGGHGSGRVAFDDTPPLPPIPDAPNVPVPDVPVPNVPVPNAPNVPVPNVPNPQIPSPAIPELPDGVKRVLDTGGKVAQVAQQQDGNFDVTRSLKATDEGTAFSYDHGGVRIQGSLKLTTTKPTADFQLRISGGTVKLAEFKLAGAGALHASIDAATQSGGQVVETSRWIGEALAFQIPLGLIGGVPFSLWIGDQFKIQIRMPGDSWVKSVGDYSLAASLGVRYADGKFQNLTGGSFDAATSAEKSDSLSVGISGLTVWDTVNFRVGIGFLGFTAGVDFSLDFRVNIDLGAPIGYTLGPGANDPVEKCRRISGYLGAEYGIGLSMPAPVQAVVNWFRKVFHAPPLPKDIKQHGKADLKNIDKVYPNSGFCQ